MNLIIFAIIFVPLLILSIVGYYDIICLRKIIGPMNRKEFEEYLKNGDCAKAVRLFGAIILWHCKYKHMKQPNNQGGE